MTIGPDIKKEIKVVASNDTEYMNILRISSYALNSINEPVGFTEIPGYDHTTEVSNYSIESIEGWVRDNDIDLDAKYEYDELDNEEKAIALVNEGKRVLLMGIEETYGINSSVNIGSRIKKEFKKFDYNKELSLSQNLKRLIIARNEMLKTITVYTMVKDLAYNMIGESKINFYSYDDIADTVEDDSCFDDMIIDPHDFSLTKEGVEFFNKLLEKEPGGDGRVFVEKFSFVLDKYMKPTKGNIRALSNSIIENIRESISVCISDYDDILTEEEE